MRLPVKIDRQSLFSIFVFPAGVVLVLTAYGAVGVSMQCVG